MLAGTGVGPDSFVTEEANGVPLDLGCWVMDVAPDSGVCTGVDLDALVGTGVASDSFVTEEANGVPLDLGCWVMDVAPDSGVCTGVDLDALVGTGVGSDSFIFEGANGETLELASAVSDFVLETIGDLLGSAVPLWLANFEVLGDGESVGLGDAVDEPFAD